jgi:hypothetical protein
MSVSINGSGSITGIDQGLNVTGILTSVGGLNVGTGGTVITTTSGGRIGIGTENPQRVAHIFGSASSGTNLLVETPSTNNDSAGIKLIPSSGNEYEIQSVVSTAGNSANSFIVYDRTNDAYRMIIDSSGRVTMPYQPMFYAYQTGGQTVTSTGIFNSTQWNATLINVGNHFNTSNGRFTAPIAGKYVFYGKGLVRWASGAGNVETTLYKNGSNVATRGLAYDYMVATNDHANQFFMVYLDLAAGDYIQYGIHELAAGTNLYYGENLGSFSGRLIG